VHASAHPAFLLRIPAMIAAAQPTPDETWMAPKGQFIRQAPHSMHFPRFATSAFRLTIEKTA
jgi:hypothetical protein